MKMKHTILHFISIALLFSMCACTGKVYTDPAFIPLSFEQSEDLEEYITEHPQLNAVVTYDDISYIGEFGDIVFLTDVEGKGDYGQYMYSLYDSNYFSFSLYVYHDGQESIKRTQLKEDITQYSDLRVLPKTYKKPQYATIGIFRYNYKTSGELHNIEWTYGEVKYVLSSSNLYLYSMSRTAETFIAKLLCPDTVAQAEAMVVGE